MIKAVNGGGGKGITIVNSSEELIKEFEKKHLLRLKQALTIVNCI